MAVFWNVAPCSSQKWTIYEVLAAPINNPVALMMEAVSTSVSDYTGQHPRMMLFSDFHRDIRLALKSHKRFDIVSNSSFTIIRKFDSV
jgi:hypothetical protein